MDWLKFLDDHSGSVIAVATIAYLAITLLLWLETRASRIAAVDAARVVVRYGVSRSGRATDIAELANFGPALAIDVRLNLAFVDALGKSQAERVLTFPALAPGDYVTVMPGLMLPRAKTHMAPTAHEMAVTGLRLRAHWTWLDGRRLLPFGRLRRQHHHIEINLGAYSDTVGEGLLLQPSSIEAVLESMREDRRRERFEDNARRSMVRSDDLPAEVQVRIEADRLNRAFDVWTARIRATGRWLRVAVVRIVPRRRSK